MNCQRRRTQLFNNKHNYAFLVSNHLMYYSILELFYSATLWYCGMCYSPVSVCLSVRLPQAGDLSKTAKHMTQTKHS